MAYQRNRAYHLEKERDVGLNVSQEGTPIPDRVCGGCAFYRKGGYCEAKRKDVGPLWEACNKYTTETPQPQDTMEKTETPTTKVCKRCGRELPLEAFGKTVRSKDGYQSNCRECQAELVRQGWEKRRAEGKAHPAPMRKKKAIPNRTFGDVYDAWNALVDYIRNRPRAHYALQHAAVDVKRDDDGFVLTFWVENDAQKKWIVENMLHEWERWMRERLGGASLLLECEVMPQGNCVAPNPALAELPDHDLAQELRRRGYVVKCSKTIEL